MSDILSLLLQHQGTPSKPPDPSGTPPEGAKSPAPAPSAPSPAPPVAPAPEVRLSSAPPLEASASFSSAAHPVSRASDAPARRREARASYAPIERAPRGGVEASPPPARTHVDDDRVMPRSLNDIAKAPIPEGLAAPARARGFPIPPVWRSRLVVYPVIALGLGLSLYVAFSSKLFSRTDAKGPNDPASDRSVDNPSGAPWLDKKPADANTPAPEGDASVNPGNGGTPARPPGLPTPGSAEGDGAAPAVSGFVIRAITYPDNSDGIERAQSTVAELVSRGFTDARWVRLPQGKRTEVVVLVGHGASPKDTALVSTVQRLIALGGFGKGQAKQRPFADAYLIRQPEADRASSSR
jgi:hypothetical protein